MNSPSALESAVVVGDDVGDDVAVDVMVVVAVVVLHIRSSCPRNRSTAALNCAAVLLQDSPTNTKRPSNVHETNSSLLLFAAPIEARCTFSIRFSGSAMLAVHAAAFVVARTVLPAKRWHSTPSFLLGETSAPPHFRRISLMISFCCWQLVADTSGFP